MAKLKKKSKGVLLIHPCAEDKTKLIGEGYFKTAPKENYFDMCKLCEILGKAHLLKELKCSEKLGLVKFELHGKTITLFKNGRFVVRMADTEEEIKELNREVFEIVQGAKKY